MSTKKTQSQGVQGQQSKRAPEHHTREKPVDQNIDHNTHRQQQLSSRALTTPRESKKDGNT